jgi:hypothetical protein
MDVKQPEYVEHDGVICCVVTTFGAVFVFE